MTTMLEAAIEARYAYAGDRGAMATEFARDLMAGDALKFKAGYTAENALLAALEVFDLDAVDYVMVGARIGVGRDFLHRTVDRARAVDIIGLA